jgi:hypothetical protein
VFFFFIEKEPKRSVLFFKRKVPKEAFFFLKEKEAKRTLNSLRGVLWNVRRSLRAVGSIGAAAGFS